MLACESLLLLSEALVCTKLIARTPDNAPKGEHVTNRSAQGEGGARAAQPSEKAGKEW